jgi:hypothetical protein
MNEESQGTSMYLEPLTWILLNSTGHKLPPGSLKAKGLRNLKTDKVKRI